jgi:uncharacterized protein (DUF58 family)
MSNGVNVELNELIALRRYAQRVNYSSARGIGWRGNYLSKLRGRGMDFAEVRNYQAGDEIRHMEWRVTARTGRPFVKLYQEERERPVVILGDFNPSMFFGTRKAFKSVVAARLASMIAWTAIKQGDRVGGVIFSAKEHNEFIPRSRDAGVLPLLASLTRYTNIENISNGAKPRLLSEVLARLGRVTRPGSLLVMISDFYNIDANSERHLSRLGSHNDVLAYHICDPLELAPPKPGHYALTNGKQELFLDTTSDEIANSYQAYCEQRLINLQDQLQGLQIKYVQVTAEDDLPRLVYLTFSRRIRG